MVLCRPVTLARTYHPAHGPTTTLSLSVRNIPLPYLNDPLLTRSVIRSQTAHSCSCLTSVFATPYAALMQPTVIYPSVRTEWWVAYLSCLVHDALYFHALLRYGRAKHFIIYHPGVSMCFPAASLLCVHSSLQSKKH